MAVGRKIFLDRADRLQRLAVPTGALPRAAERLRRRGIEVIDLSRLSAAPPSNLPAAHTVASVGTDDLRPASARQLTSLREAVAAWEERRFGISLDSEREIAIVPNAAVGLYLLCLAFVDTGDLALLPDPGAAFYRSAVVLCGGGIATYRLRPHDNYLPDFSVLRAGLTGRTRLLILSYPHNPTAATADLNTFAEATAFARRSQLLVVFDGAFVYAAANTLRPHTFLETPGSTGVGCEICSIGTNFGMNDLPLAAICGNRDVVSAVSFIMEKSELIPCGHSAELAQRLLSEAEGALAQRVERLEAARQLLVEAVTEIGWTPRSSPTVPFIWAGIPSTLGSESFCRRVLRRTGILLSPGTDFGMQGEGFVRIVVPADPDAAQSVVKRLRQHVRLFQHRIPRRRRHGPSSADGSTPASGA